MYYDPDSFAPCHILELRAHILFELGENIKKIRKNSGDTQEDLAKALNITRSAISKYESGDLDMPISLLPLIASRYSIKVNSFFGDNTDRISADLELINEIVTKLIMFFKEDIFLYTDFTPIIAKYYQDYKSINSELFSI